jgi:type VI secretion system protein ImpM
MPNAAAVGFFGKLPCRGDFLQRRVAREFIDVWDPWLQHCIDQSARALRERWLGAYLTAPVWRFVLAEGICGSNAYAGVMVSGVDRVGRYFPLTIVAEWPAQECALESACDARQWFDAAEAVALTAPEAVDLEAFDAQVARLTALIDTSGAEESAHLRRLLSRTDTLQHAAQWHVPLGSVHSLSRALSAVALRELERALRPVSLWWSDGSDDVEAAWLCTRGLPAPESFAAMLSGEWTTAGWSSLGAAAVKRVQPQPLLQAQEFQMAVVHESMDRRWVDEQWNDAEPETCFTARPEIGLWGVSTALDADCGRAAAQALVDVLQNIRPAGTLTTLVEQVRAALEAVQRQFAARSSIEASATIAASAVVFVTVGAECAVLCSGPAQVVRSRASAIAPICGFGVAGLPLAQAPVARQPVRDSAAVNGTLLDLVTGSAVACVSLQEIVQVQVCYDSVQADDRWLISAARLLDEQLLTELAVAFKFDGEESLTMVRDICAAEDLSGRQLPVLLLTARAIAIPAEPVSTGRAGQG